MSELIVLGLIPGTEIQITFPMWLLVSSGLFALAIAHFIHRRHLLRNAVITLVLFQAARRPFATALSE